MTFWRRRADGQSSVFVSNGMSWHNQGHWFVGTYSTDELRLQLLAYEVGTLLAMSHICHGAQREMGP